MKIRAVWGVILCVAAVCWGQSSPDLNEDGIVDFLDLSILASEWLKATGGQGPNDVNIVSPCPPVPEPNGGSGMPLPTLPIDYGIRNPFGWDGFGKPVATAPYEAGDVVWRLSMDDVSKWTTYACSLANTTDAAGGTDYSRTDGKLMVQTPTGTYTSAYAYYRWGAIYNGTAPPLEKCYCKLKYYVPTGEHLPTDIVFFIKGKNYSGTSKQMWIGLPITPGEHDVEFCLSALSQIDEGCEGVNPPAEGLITDFNNLEYMMFAINGDPSIKVYWDSVEFVRNADRPKMILSFDDGLLNQYEVIRPILNSRGIRAIFYIIREKALNPYQGQLYMGVNQVLELQSEGHLVGNHSTTHDSFWSLYTVWTNKRWQETQHILENRMWLESIGIDEGRYSYCQPNGSARFTAPYEPVGTNQEKATRRRDWISFVWANNLHTRLTGYVKWVDGAICANEQSRVQRHIFPNPGSFRMLGYAIRPSQYEIAKYMMDAAIRDNGLVSFYWHSIGTHPSDPNYYSMSEGDFTAVIDYAIAHNFEFVTWADLIPAVNR